MHAGGAGSKPEPPIEGKQLVDDDYAKWDNVFMDPRAKKNPAEAGFFWIFTDVLICFKCRADPGKENRFRYCAANNR
jgi:hypothetical protein